MVRERRMADYISYEGYRIHCSAKRVPDREGWIAKVRIEPEVAGKAAKRTLEPDAEFAGEDEAILYGFRYGKRAIDDEVEGSRPPAA